MRCTSAKLVRRIASNNGANEWQQIAARELLPVYEALSRNKNPLRAGENKKQRKNNARPPQLKQPRAPDMSLR